MRAAGKEIPAALLMLMSLSFTVISLTLAAKDDEISMVPKGCRDKCGNLNISYPFGIGPNKDCYLNEWFLINCTEFADGVEKPYLSSFSDDHDGGAREILDISLDPQTITIKDWISPFSCQTTAGGTHFSIFPNTKLSGTPFSYSSTFNKFMILGCGKAILTLSGGLKLGNCTSLCGQNTQLEDRCNGKKCCQLFLADDVKTYQVSFTNSAVNVCNYAFFVEENWFPQSFPGSRKEELGITVVWQWAITSDYLPLSSQFCWPSQSRYNQSEGSYWECDCYPKKGNPYIANGCQDAIGSRRKLTVKELSTIIGVSASFGFILLLLACYILCKAIKKSKLKKQRQNFFKRNGGLLLEQQLLTKKGTVEKVKLFTANELDKATDHFNANRILGRGGQGTVYKGMLTDGQIVAIKKSQIVDEKQLEPFINEVVILSQINHRNVVKLLGCCLETEVPILVYEFIPNGTLFNLIHNNPGDELIPLSWDIRLRIALETADAITYLHSATSIPVYHRDIKSSNILLDEKFRAKVSDFGTSRSISIDQTHLTTIVKGTFGYLDPEYFRSSQFTEKSDVYSFGVVLVELLTRQKPISFEIDDDEEDRSLVMRFLLCMEENRLTDILDVQLLEQGKKKDVFIVAWLAQRCLNLNGKERPTMREVAAELDAIRTSHSHLPSAIKTLDMESDFVI